MVGAPRADAASPELEQLKAWQERTRTPKVPNTPKALRRKVFASPQLRRIKTTETRCKSKHSAKVCKDSRLHQRECDEEERTRQPFATNADCCYQARSSSTKLTPRSSQGGGPGKKHETKDDEQARTRMMRENVAQLHSLQTKMRNLEAVASDAHARVKGTSAELRHVRVELDRTFAELRETLRHAKQRRARLMLEAELLNAQQSILAQRCAVSRREAREADARLLDAQKNLRRLVCKQEDLRPAASTPTSVVRSTESTFLRGSMRSNVRPRSAATPFLMVRDAQVRDAEEAKRQRTLRALFHKLQYQVQSTPGPLANSDRTETAR